MPFSIAIKIELPESLVRDDRDQSGISAEHKSAGAVFSRRENSNRTLACLSLAVCSCLTQAGAANAFTSCAADEAASRSPRSATHIMIGYRNGENYPQQWIWIDHDGRRRVYKVLQPGQSIEQPTYVGHVWVVTGPQGECQALFVAGVGG